MSMTRRCISIPDVIWEQLRVAGERRGVGISEMLRRAAERLLEEENASIHGSDRENLRKAEGDRSRREDR